MTHVNIPQSFCRAGAARGDITPPVGLYHRMWGAATHDRSTGVHRPLFATVFVIRPEVESEAKGGFVLVALDHCILGEEDLAKIRSRVAEKTSFKPDDVRVTLSHTHGAGLMMRNRADLPGGSGISAYLDEVADRAADLAATADRELRPVAIIYAKGRCDLAVQRDFYDEAARQFVCGFNPAATADDTLRVARVEERQSRQILATIVNYACHPTTLAWQNTLISPDFVGAMRETVESATGGAPCVFLQGASGELAPREQYTGDVTVADRNGRQLGFAALSALSSLPDGVAGQRYMYAGPVVSGALLGTWTYEPLEAEEIRRASVCESRSWLIDLPRRGDLPTLEQSRTRRDELTAEEQSARDRGDDAAARDLRARVEQLTRQIMRLEALPPGNVFPLKLSVLRIGDAVWVFAAGEHYSALQTKLRERFPCVTLFVTTVTNGWQPGYLPTAETYGKGIYQENICLVAAGSLEKVIDDIASQISEWVDDDQNK